MLYFKHKIKLSGIVLILLMSFYSYSYSMMKPAYKRSETPLSIANFNKNDIQKGEPYFPLLIYEGPSNSTKKFAESDWSPYKPRYDHFTDYLENDDLFARLNKLKKDGVFNGIIFYNTYWYDWVIKLQKKMIKKYNFQFFVQIYNKNNSQSRPIEEIPEFAQELAKQTNANWYFMDDYAAQSWSLDDISKSSKMIKQLDPNKKILAAPGIQATKELSRKLFKFIDIYAPQNYSCKKILPLFCDLEDSIPEFYDIINFHYTNLQFLNYVQDFNKLFSKKIIFGLTLPIYHMNNQESNKYVHRFPTYNESRFFFYDAVICKAKVLSYFSLYRCNKKSYEDITRIIKEFNKTKFKEAIINGKFTNNILDNNSIQINKDRKHRLGAKIWDLDYIMYQYKDAYYIIMANVSSNFISTDLIIKEEKVKTVENISLDKGYKIVNKKLPIDNNNFRLNIKPFEVKLLILKP